MSVIYQAILVLIVIIIIYCAATCARGNIRESMTRIRRGVGFANEADEIPVAAGIIHSAPIMDYTHTYWDGARTTSCDECPNKYVCPTCPAMVGAEGMESGGDAAEPFDLTVGTHGYESAVVDVNADYATSREYMGAARGPIMRSGARYNDGYTTERLTENTFDTRIIPLGCGSKSRKINDFLYGSKLCGPAPEPCTFYNTIGLLYQEPCPYSAPVIAQLGQ